tara:strand:+ start:224 stop:820 length:597 start_codon:yes stop_codon:yes gene_type:complete
MIIRKFDLDKYDRIKRLKLINAICGIRSVHLIGSKSINNNSNLAIFSSVNHLGSNPALLSFISRPANIVNRDTLSNIKQTKHFTINSIEENIIKNAHQTSGKYHSDKSEFQACNIQEQYIDAFPAPFVANSNIKIGLKFLESIIIKHNQTELVIGEITLIKTRYKNLEKNFNKTLSIIGLNSYYSHHKAIDLPYVKNI